MTTVHNNVSLQRYEIYLPDNVLAGFANYERNGQRVELPHMEVTLQYKRQGFAGKLTQAALQDIQEFGLLRHSSVSVCKNLYSASFSAAVITAL